MSGAYWAGVITAVVFYGVWRAVVNESRVLVEDVWTDRLRPSREADAAVDVAGVVHMVRPDRRYACLGPEGPRVGPSAVGKELDVWTAGRPCATCWTKNDAEERP